MPKSLETHPIYRATAMSAARGLADTLVACLLRQTPPHAPPLLTLNTDEHM